MKRLHKDCGASPFRDLKTIVRDLTVLNEFSNGLPTQTFNKWTAWGIKAAVCYNSSSTVLEFLQLINFSLTGAVPKQSSNIKNGAPQYPCRNFSKYLLARKT